MVRRAAPPNPVAEVVEMSEGGRQAAKPDRFPEYLDELELPGEAEIHQQIADLKGELAAATAKVDGLNHWKLLVGELSGDPFENLVVEALNLVLEGTGYVAEERPDGIWLVRRG